MKRMKLIVMAGLVVALCTPAWAVTVPSLPTPYVYMEGTARTNGTTYSADDGTYVYDDTQSRWEDKTTGNPATITESPAPGAIGNEDTWGAYGLEVLRPGDPVVDTNPFSPTYNKVVSMDSGGPISYLWDSDQTTGLVGLFYGGVDKQLDVSTGLATVWVEEATLELYAAPTSQINGDQEGPEYVSARRTANDTYTGWVEPNNNDWVPLLQLKTDYFKFVPTGFSTGSTTIYASVTDSEAALNTFQWNKLLLDMPNTFTWDDAAYGSGTSDLWLSFGITGDNKGWSNKGIDNGGFGAVPEPLTMLAVSGAVMGLGGYIRRRRD